MDKKGTTVPDKPIFLQRVLLQYTLSLFKPEHSEVQQSLILLSILSHWRNTTQKSVFNFVSSPLHGLDKSLLFEFSLQLKKKIDITQIWELQRKLYRL